MTEPEDTAGQSERTYTSPTVRRTVTEISGEGARFREACACECGSSSGAGAGSGGQSRAGHE
jgi:hypothetical protein